MNEKPEILALFSQGLDSILAIKIIQEQGLRVQALKFITPFFGYEIKGQESKYCEKIKKNYAIDLEIIDLTNDYLKMLAAPEFGYGKNFNPCLDCKVMMLTRARIRAEALQVKAIVTGEVVGQRPFSQRRDTMRRIEKLSSTDGLLLRPLSAKLLMPTRAEEEGLIDREKLFDFSGRGRKPQMALADKLNITDYLTPAGGCLLTDPGFAKRVRTLYQHDFIPSASDLELLKFGRFYPLGKADEFIIVGRNRLDNQKLLKTATSDYFIIQLTERAGPVTVLKGTETQLPEAAEKLCLHSKAKELESVKVNWRRGDESGSLTVRRPQ
ncbi:thiamine biosynthesis protein [bacterium]|nr:thiamine biosynthesis protein [bacterium]